MHALWAYLEKRGPSPGPLFLFHSGTLLTRAALVDRLHLALQQSGLEPTTYNGHSFRIGAATTAAECGIEDSMIQTLGRWKSSAYLAYRSCASNWPQCQPNYCASSANSSLHRLTFCLPPYHYIHCITWCQHIGGIITLTFN